MNAVNPVQSSIAAGDHAPAAEPSMEEILASIRRIIADDQSFPGHPQAGMPAPEAAPAPILDVPEAPPPPVVDTQETAPMPALEALAAIAPAESVTGDEAMHVPHMHVPPGPEAAAPHETMHPSHVESVDAAETAHDAHAPQLATPDGSSPEPLSAPAAPEVAGMGSVEEDLEAALASVIPPEPSAGPTVASSDVEPPAADTLFSPAIDSSVTTAFNTLAASRLVANADELRGLVREMIRPLLKTWIEEHLPRVVERLVAAEIERIARGG